MANFLSRMPLPNETEDNEDSSAFVVEFSNAFSTFQKVQIATQNDDILQKVLGWCKGWPEAMKQIELAEFYNEQYDLTIQENCLWKGQLLVLPEILRNRYIEDLHKQHWETEKVAGNRRGYQDESTGIRYMFIRKE